MSSFRNPIGYHCQPNEATPEYVPERNFQQFLAYGLLLCDIPEEYTTYVIGEGQIQDSREQFLKTVENALQRFASWERGKNNTQEEALEPHVFLSEDPENEDGDFDLCDWYLDMIAIADPDGDGAGDLVFIRRVTGNDDDAIWLSGSAVKTKKKRRRCLAEIEKARRALHNLKGRETTIKS